MDSLFTKIINGEIKSDKVYEDDLCIAIHDISPQAPIHVLIIPKEPIAMLRDLTERHKSLMGHLMHVTTLIADQLDTSDNYRVVINNGPDAGQSVYHIHIHLLAGRGLSWPPG